MKRLLPLIFLLACGPPSPEAPTELSGLVRFLFAEHDNEDPTVMEQGLGNLAALLDAVDLTGDAVDRSWIPGALIADDIEGLTRPEDRDLAALLSIALAGQSAFGTQDHALLQIQSDQLPGEPTATRYERLVTEPEDPACFVSGECEHLRTSNDVRRENFLMSVDFMLRKDFRWSSVGTEADAGEDRPRAIAARSWFEQSWPGDNGNTMLWQSYSLDLWLDDGKGAARRFQALWSESEVVDVSEDVLRNVLRNSIGDVYVAADEAIAALLTEG